MYLKIPRSIYKNENVTDYELVTYTALQKMLTIQDEETGFIPVFTGAVVYNLYGTFDVEASIQRNITACIDGLLSKKILCGEKCKNGKYIIGDHRESGEDFYAYIDYVHLTTIMRSAFNRKGSLFRYYCVLMGSRNNSIRIDDRTGFVSTVSIDYLANEMSCYGDTIRSYNKLLENMHIIYILRRIGSDIGPRTHNLYGTYEDKDLIDQYGENVKGQETAKYNSSDDSRKLSVEYDRYVEDPDSFDLMSLHRLYNRVIVHNESVNDGRSTGKLYNLDVFSMEKLAKR